MQAFLRALLLVAAALTGFHSASAQLSPRAAVSLITVYPGDAVYSLWGHSALRIHDPERGIDIAYNYGTFDFGHPVTFAARFAYGKLDYSLSRQHYPALVDQAKHVQERSVVEQHLALSDAQKQVLFQFLERNALPENRTYRYDFLFDNCSTRIRDLFTEVLGLALPASAASERTYRQLLHPYAGDQSILQLGINLGMGMPADREAADRSFLPLEFMDVLAAMQTDSGALVARTDTVHLAAAGDRIAIPWATMVAWLAFGLGVWATLRGRARTIRAFDRVFYTAVGLAGLLIAFLWLVSLHNVTHPNLNVAWLWPTHAVVALWRRKSAWLRFYHMGSCGLAACFVAALPLLPQSVPAAAIPLALLAALRSGHLAWRSRQP